MSSSIPVAGSYQRNFGHCIVSWTIKNYFLAACNPGTEIISKAFHVHSSQDTHWQIGFRVDERCQVFLRRLSDVADEWIKVTWSVTMFDGNGEKAFCENDGSFFKEYSQNVINVPDPSDISQVLDSDLGEVRIEIQMIVFMNGKVRIPKLSDSHLQSLVNDLQFAASEQLYTDLTIHLNVEAICGHRAMMLTRSNTLERAEGDTNTRRYCVHHGDTEAFDSLICYLYTSDLLYIFGTPSVSIYRLIVDLNITELLHAYPKEKITMETTIEATEFFYRWTIPAFIYDDNLPNSNVYEVDGRNSKGMDWTLRIFPTEEAGDDETQAKYVCIKASLVNNTAPQHAVVCIKARNKDDPISVIKRKYGKVQRDMNLETKFMRIDNPLVENSYYTLYISFSVHIGTGARASIITETSPPVGFWLTHTTAFRILQRHLKDLLENSLYSDITLLIEDHEFKCHKFLLAARSSAFYSIFVERPGASLAFRYINRKVFGVFLHYLYTGALPDLEPGTTSNFSVIFFMHLYELSMNFTVQNLTCLCLERLTSELSLQNACCMLVFAEERRLSQLKDKILELFSLHPRNSIHSECRRRLQKKNPELLLRLGVLFFNSYRSEFDMDAKLSVPDLLGLNAMIK